MRIQYSSWEYVVPLEGEVLHWGSTVEKFRREDGDHHDNFAVPCVVLKCDNGMILSLPLTHDFHGIVVKEIPEIPKPNA